MDMKTFSTIIGHVSAATMLDIYGHITDDMQQAMVNIERHIGITDAEIPEQMNIELKAKSLRVSKFKPS